MQEPNQRIPTHVSCEMDEAPRVVQGTLCLRIVCAQECLTTMAQEYHRMYMERSTGTRGSALRGSATAAKGYRTGAACWKTHFDNACEACNFKIGPAVVA